MSASVWIDGEPCTKLPVALPGWPFADGVFRTALVYQGQVHDMAGQIAHLQADGERLDLRAPDADWAGWLAQAAQGCARGRLRMMLLRAAGGAGYQSTQAPARCWIDLRPLAPAPNAEPLKLVASPITLAEQPALAGIKHLNRLEQVLTARAAADAVCEQLLCDASGRPICTGRANLFWVREGVLHTPALDRCGIAGRTRARIIELAAADGRSVQQGDWPLASLQSAEEVFVCNSLIGIRPIADSLGQELPAPGPVTLRLIQQLQHPM